MTVISRNTSHKPRVSKKTESCCLLLPRCHHRNAPSPAVNMKVGAQTWVTQRVRKSAGVVVWGWVGEEAMGGGERGRVGWCEIGGRGSHGAAMNEVAYVIQRHENHNGAANRVDGLHAPG